MAPFSHSATHRWQSMQSSGFTWAWTLALLLVFSMQLLGQASAQWRQASQSSGSIWTGMAGTPNKRPIYPIVYLANHSPCKLPSFLSKTNTINHCQPAVYISSPGTTHKPPWRNQDRARTDGREIQRPGVQPQAEARLEMAWC